MENYSFINMVVSHVFSGSFIEELNVEVLVHKLDLSTSGDFSTDLGVSLGVVFTSDVILEVFSEISNNIPQELHLVLDARG